MNERIFTSGCLVFMGAAVSRAAPANLPMAADVSGLLSQWLIVDAPEEVLLKVSRIWASLPFELGLELLSDAEERLVSAVLGEILRTDTKPNANHLALARLMHDGRVGLVLTTNFDLLLEGACANGGMSVEKIRRRIRHLHGIAGHTRFAPRATLREIARGIVSRSTRKLLHHELVSSRRVVFVGYSGRDLDLQPFFFQHCGPHWVFLGRDEASNFLHERGVEDVPLVVEFGRSSEPSLGRGRR